MSVKKKHGKSRPGTSPHGSDEPHLDETITQLAVTTGSSLQKHWRSITAVVVVTAAAVLGMRIVSALEEAREAEHHERLRGLTADETPRIDALLALVEDVRGAGAERPILKGAVQYLLAAADRAEEGSAAAGGEDAGSAQDVGGAGAPTSAEILSAVEKVVAAGESRFTGDADIARWAAGARRKIAAERDRSWLPPERAYELQLPAGGAADGEGETPAPAGPDAAGESDTTGAAGEAASEPAAPAGEGGEGEAPPSGS